MEIARDEKLPMIIHSREAAQDTVEIMKAARSEEIGGVIHCYSYSKEIAKIFLDMGFYIGIGGVVTFKNAKKLKEVAEYVPIDRIVLETDSPYLAPVPNRGKRNSSQNLPYVAQQIAELKGISYDEVVQKTYKNALRLYRME
jgi:TatD DNase family protein